MILLEVSSFLKDYSDYVVLIPSVILGGIIAYWIYLKQKNIKELTYEKVSLNNIVEIDSKFRNSIEVKFNGDKVDNLWLLIIKIVNSGNTPIEKKDFDTSLSIEFNEGSQVLDAEVISTFPNNLQIEINHSSGKIEISPTLLNFGDNYSIRAMISGAKPKFILNARISGVKKLVTKNFEKQNSMSNSRFLLDKSIWVAMIAGLFIAFTEFSTTIEMIFVKPEVEILNQNLYKEKNKPLGNIELIPTNSSAKNKYLIYYKINTRDELFGAVKQNGQWIINIDNYQESLVNGRNEVCYKFEDDGKSYHCLTFNVIPQNKE